MESSHLSSGRHHDLVVMGASAGGVEALKEIVAHLPADLRAAVCVVLHVAPDSPSALAAILGRSGPLPCQPARDGDPLVSGRILVAPPNHHLVIEDGHVRLTVGPRENNHRPAVDALFRSAALARDAQVVGVVLSGNRDDGTVGLAVIKAHGGVAVVQDPQDALHPGMPSSAVANVTVDAVVPSSEIAATVAAMVNGDYTPHPPMSDLPTGQPQSEDSAVTICPECGGVLTERDQAGTAVWQCRVGHRYSPESLADAQSGHIEAALWTAIRALEDRAILMQRMAAQLSRGGQTRSAQRFQRRARDADEQAQMVRRAVADAARTTLRDVSGDAEGVPSAQEGLA